MRIVESPTLHEILDGQAPEPRQFPYMREWEDIKSEPLVILHTSGSTGMPKIINITHDYCANGAEQMYIPPYHGRLNAMSHLISSPALRTYICFPPFHMAGLVFTGFAGSMYGDMVYVFGPAHLPPTGRVFVEVVNYGRVVRTVAVPSTLMELASSQEGLDCLSKLESAVFAGGKFSGYAVHHNRPLCICYSWSPDAS